jgi:hypothetical protein
MSGKTDQINEGRSDKNNLRDRAKWYIRALLQSAESSEVKASHKTNNKEVNHG